MGKKKSTSRDDAQPRFRESDFAGMAPQTQAELSGSLNQLSEQMAASRKLLQDMGPPPVLPTPSALSAPDPSAGSPPADNPPNDDDPPVPPAGSA